MKTMTCRELGGACDLKFHTETFEEMAERSKKHAVEMAGKGSLVHIEKMNEMKNLMNQPTAMVEWFEKVKKKFDALPEDK